MKSLVSAFIVLVSSISILQAQINIPHYSEPASLTQQVGNTHFKIKYERPKKNDRKIFGGLVPYDEVWRTGSSECTKISFDTEVYIDLEKIKAGTYSLFTIPTEDEWTIILNTDTTLYGAYDYDQGKDVLRFTMSPRKTDHWSEAFDIGIDVVDDKAEVNIRWEDLLVIFEIETKTYENLRKEINDILENDYELGESTYANAADFILHNRSGFGEDYLVLAEKLIDKAFRMEGKSSYRYAKKKQILKIQGKEMEYIKVSKEHIQYLEEAKPYEGYELDVENIKKELAKMH